MSHTTTVKSLVITSIPTLERALAALTSKGIRCTLHKGSEVHYRTYDNHEFQRTKGQERPDYVIQVEGSRYDIGLVAVPETPGAYELCFDGMGINPNISVQGQAVHDPLARIGKLTYEYSRMLVEETAAYSGFTIESAVQGKDGSLNMQLLAN